MVPFSNMLQMAQLEVQLVILLIIKKYDSENFPSRRESLKALHSRKPLYLKQSSCIGV